MRKIIIFAIIGILTLSVVSAGWFDWLLGTSHDTLDAMNITNKNFNIKTASLNQTQICIKDDSLKVVKNAQCQKEKPKYSMTDLSATNLFYQNTDGLVRFRNG